jgi:hypothetical protein
MSPKESTWSKPSLRQWLGESAAPGSLLCENTEGNLPLVSSAWVVTPLSTWMGHLFASFVGELEQLEGAPEHLDFGAMHLRASAESTASGMRGEK